MTIITKSGFEEKKKEYVELSQKRKIAVEELAWARDLGDKSENAAYKSARSKLSRLDSRIRFLKKILNNSEIIESTKKDIVGIGSVVKIQNGEKMMQFEIVGDHEASPIVGKISYRSPVGSALINKKVGDIATIVTPSGMTKCKIIDIK